MPSNTLSRGDTAWLRMDSPTNWMVVNGFFQFAHPLDRDRLVAALENGFLRYERFRQRVEDKPGWFARPRWVDHPEFDIDQHLLVETLPEPGDDAALSAAIEARVRTPLDLARPLWELRIYQGYGGGSALLVRIHHCIADGIALMQVLLDACEPVDGAARDAPRIAPKRPWYWWAALPVTALAWTVRFLFVSGWLIFRRADRPTLYKGRLSGVKRVAWTPNLSLARVKQLSQKVGCKINDLLMAVTAAALARYAERRGQPLEAVDLRAMVPVNRRSAKAAKELGNAFALVSPALPVDKIAPDDRVRKTKRRMDKIKKSPEPISTVILLKVLGLLGVRMQHRVQRFLVEKATLVLTNVPGPRKKLAMAGVPIERFIFWVPMFGPTGLGVSIFTYADEITIGVLTDEALVPDPQALADAVVAELDHLESALRG